MRRWRRWVLVVVLVWVGVVVWWATKPVTDSVFTGTTADGVETSHNVQCDSPLSGNTTSPDPLPELAKGRAYDRTPCELPIQNGRIILGVDIAVALIVIVILAKTWKPNAVTEPSDEMALV